MTADPQAFVTYIPTSNQCKVFCENN